MRLKLAGEREKRVFERMLLSLAPIDRTRPSSEQLDRLSDREGARHCSLKVDLARLFPVL